MRKPAEKQRKAGARSTPGTFSRLMKYMFSYYRFGLILSIVCIVLAAVSSSVATIFLQRLIDVVITPGIKSGLSSVHAEMMKIMATMISVYAVGVLGSLIYTQILARVTQGTLRHMRDDMFSNMEKLPIRYFDTNEAGDIMSTYTNDTDAIRQMIGQSMPTIIQTVLSLAAILVVMLRFSIWMTLITLVFLMLMIFVTKNFGGNSSRYMIKQQKSLAAEEGFVEEIIAGQKVVQAYCHEQEAEKDLDRLNDQLFRDSAQANKYGNMLMPVLNNLGNIMYVVLAIIGGLLTVFHATNISLTGIHPITIGIIVSFLSMSRQMSQAIGQASMQMPMIAMGLAGAGRVFDLMDQVPEEDHGTVELVNAEYAEDGSIREADRKTDIWAWKCPEEDGSVSYVPLKGDVRFFDVDFGYDPDKLVLHDISLFAKPGQKIAFVGATGAGKTTITNLINRFYDIPDGKIKYDGINIDKIKKPDLRRSLGVVLQDVNLFTGTVMENIRYGRLDATDEECIEAAKLANADCFISMLPDGYDTMLTNNGEQLSQGQRQLISIARAAVDDPPVMILDEATSSIDTRTEELVEQGMDNLMEGRTVFVIAHRLSTVRNSKAIMVLDHGRIIERGSHEDLIAQHGVYYQLYTGAFEME
ncbi:MAG: ABC transporter ATP-binding protein [Anaerovoracaceae bacterium]